MATNTVAMPPNLPKCEAISKGYNFASTWEQNAPLTEQQQGAILMLSHAVAERPYPANLAQERTSGQDTGLSVCTKANNFGDSGAIEAILVNTNQFYKWFTDLESAMWSEVTAVKVALSSGTQNKKIDSVMAKPLKEQAFATPEKVAELVRKVNSAVQQELPLVTAKMKLYLQNPTTRTILFKPIKLLYNEPR